MEELTREDLLGFVYSMALEEFKDLIPDNIESVMVIDPWDKTVCFSDSFSSIIGAAAMNAMYLTQYYLYIPEGEREIMANKYEAVISELLTGALDKVTLSHSVIYEDKEKRYVDVNMKIFAVDKKRYVLGFVVDKTLKEAEIGYRQLFDEGINTYAFTFNTETDTCRLSNRFIEDFDLRSPVVENFVSFYPQFLMPEDGDPIREMFNAYLRGDSVEGGRIRLLAPGRGEINLRIEGMSSGPHGDYERSAGSFISGIMTDITDFMREDEKNRNLLESSDAITFYADIDRAVLHFSPQIRMIIPEARLSIEGDFVEEVADMIVPDDKRRFRNMLHRAVNEPGTAFSLEFRLMRPNGKTMWVACRGKSYYEMNSRIPALVGTLFNLSAMNVMKDNIEKNSLSNEVTGLPGRDRLINDTETLLRRKELLSAAIVLFDIHDFHAFNDRYGRDAGNSILLSLSLMLKENMPEGVRLYHIGIDTFALLWPEASQIKVSSYMNDMQDRLVTPLETKEGSFFVSAGMSAAFYPLGSSVDELMTHAEIALHKVKQNKKLKYAIYSPVDMHELKERVDFETQISQSVRNNMENFTLYYQPLVNAKTGMLEGAEALLRYNLPSGETVNPEKVVAALEMTDQMSGVGEWILKEAVSQCSQWIAKGAPEDFYIHINATADDLVTDNYADLVVNVLSAYDLKPSNILIELTETSLMKNMSLCRKNLYDLSSKGIRTALDDFGSGYSSFNYLKELPVDEIKIDKTFVDDMETVDFDRSFISAMTMLAHSIGKKVVVEGVESESQAAAIREMGADIFQGYLFGKPMSVFAFYNKYFSN